MTLIKKITATLALIALLGPAALALGPKRAEAAVADWQQGIIMISNSEGELGNDSTKQSIRNLKATGASHVAFVITYYQSDLRSNDLHRGWNTPSDQALATAIDYAHSQGLKVFLMVRPEVYDGTWRAHINPSDRSGWFNNYAGLLVPLARLAQEHGVEVISLGTEMAMLTATRVHWDAAKNWSALIDKVRAVYSGQLTYGANSTNNNTDHFQNEKNYIDFWHKLDFVGLSVYYNMDTPNNDVNSLKGVWDYWNQNDLKPFSQKVGKPIVFTEIGYRSVDGAHYEPWNWSKGGAPNMTEQANAYQALMEYWNNYSYVNGVYWWNWQINPGAGGSGDTDYTPQNKPAEGIVKNWFTGGAPPPPPPPPPPPGEVAISGTGSVSPAAPAVGQALTLTADVKNTGTARSDLIVDLEVYNESNQKVHQQFFGGQSLGTKTFTTNWTPGTAGKYRLAIGVFNNNWSQNFYWNGEAANFTVGTNTPPPPPPPPPNSGNLEVWWPGDGVTVSGTQPFKAMVAGSDVSQYKMFWQVDGDRLNEMYDSPVDYPHKEAWVDVGSWNWRASGPYKITFVAQNSSGQKIAEKTISITIAR